METKRKKLITLLVLLFMLIPVSTKAANPVITLVVLTKDKAEHYFALTDKPKVTFSGKKLKVTCSKASASATFTLADVVRFTYKKLDPTGIDELVEDPASLNFEDGVLVISNLKANASVGVYTLDGKPVKQLHAARTGTFRLSLSELPSGVYIVKAGTITYKIAKP